MFQIDSKSRKSIYLQIVDNIKELAVKGVLEEDSKLPSVREMSKLLMVNPNTIQKAYRELERQGFVYSTSGLGTFIAPVSEMKVDQDKYDELKKQLEQVINEMQFLGIEREEIEELIKSVLRKGGAGND